MEPNTILSHYRNEITRIESNIPMLIASGAVIVIEVVIAAVILKKFKDRYGKELKFGSGGIKWEDVFPSNHHERISK